jgi:hypothetical protein
VKFYEQKVRDRENKYKLQNANADKIDKAEVLLIREVLLYWRFCSVCQHCRQLRVRKKSKAKIVMQFKYLLKSHS